MKRQYVSHESQPIEVSFKGRRIRIEFDLAGVNPSVIINTGAGKWTLDECLDEAKALMANDVQPIPQLCNRDFMVDLVIQHMDLMTLYRFMQCGSWAFHRAVYLRKEIWFNRSASIPMAIKYLGSDFYRLTWEVSYRIANRLYRAYVSEGFWQNALAVYDSSQTPELVIPEREEVLKAGKISRDAAAILLDHYGSMLDAEVIHHILAITQYEKCGINTFSCDWCVISGVFPSQPFNMRFYNRQLLMNPTIIEWFTQNPERIGRIMHDIPLEYYRIAAASEKVPMSRLTLDYIDLDAIVAEPILLEHFIVIPTNAVLVARHLAAKYVYTPPQTD